jgi:hypothetical protein
MTARSLRAGLVLFAGAACTSACGPTPSSEPPPRVAGAVPTAIDAGPPVVQPTGRGVIVPSDVKLEPPPNPSPGTRDPALAGSVASPGSN